MNDDSGSKRDMVGALKRASSRIRSLSDTSTYQTPPPVDNVPRPKNAPEVQLASSSANKDLVKAARERVADPSLPQAPLMHGRDKLGEVGQKAWVYKPNGKDADSYATMATRLDTIGAKIHSSYSGDKRKDYTPSQFAAHATLLAFKGKTDKLRSEYQLSHEDINELRTHASVMMGAETGRSEVAGVSNFLMLHRMKHDGNLTFSGDKGTLTGVQAEQLRTKTTSVSTSSFLAAPYGSMEMMDQVQTGLRSYPDNPDDVYSKKKKQTMRDAWSSGFKQKGKQHEVTERIDVARSKIVPKVVKGRYQAKDDTVPGGRVDVSLPGADAVIGNEANRLSEFIGYKERKHGKRVDPDAQLERSVLRYFDRAETAAPRVPPPERGSIYHSQSEFARNLSRNMFRSKEASEPSRSAGNESQRAATTTSQHHPSTPGSIYDPRSDFARNLRGMYSSGESTRQRSMSVPSPQHAPSSAPRTQSPEHQSQSSSPSHSIYSPKSDFAKNLRGKLFK
ncbi:hypothetical protein KIH87_01095 [Paraneptunicella aestuarii]|uniref:hypothetical protein n=1 Tax=Paraneptunicella aestuarii TaxID=2831148 RepID=UPI001E5D425E|nr:hypothetical protein [Paraneptunicella aestuarii]UAA38998.1 hypothetical protein KIH87_01095 [Paraneptunicella aestuarii]